MVCCVFGPATEAVMEIILDFPGFCNLLILLLFYHYFGKPSFLIKKNYIYILSLGYEPRLFCRPSGMSRFEYPFHYYKGQMFDI